VVNVKIGRLSALVVFSIVCGIGILFVGQHSEALAVSWIVAGAVLGLIVTFYVGWWAKQKSRLSVGLMLLLLGNLIAFTIILLPLHGNKSALYDIPFSLYVISFVVRLFSSWRLLKNK
jgi:hypothetical protein